MESNIDIIKKSYGRCMFTRESKQQFFNHFYQLFLHSDPEIALLFQDTEFEKQVTLLKHAISMSIMFAEDNNDLAKSVLMQTRKSHSRSRKNIKPEYYTFWLDCLMHTFWACDPQFNEALEKSWRELLQITIDYIKEGYEH